ncbi:MAG: DUF1016 N-terminal domain-containing protein [Mediterranea sp.]|jgi:hypothetical protein|nr:DUF1016 N-terminal domain-containing protein [Mediterranea sp.]
MNKLDKNIERKEFDKYIHAISVEIEQAQVKLISAANVQMLLHYWKIGNFILYNQIRLGWGSKFIERTSEALRKLHPQKKGYSPRNLTYMCQFAKLYPIEIIEQLIIADQELDNPTIAKVLSLTNTLSEYQFGQEAPAQIQSSDTECVIFAQEVPAQMEDVSKTLAVATNHSLSQYALSGYNQPIGVSDYQLSKAIPEELKSALPTIEEVEEELSHLLEENKLNG